MQGGSCTGVNFVLFLPQIKSWSCTLHLKIVKMHRNLIPWWSLKLVYDKASSQPGSTYTIQGWRNQCRELAGCTANVCRDLRGVYREIRVRGFQIYGDCMQPTIPVILKSPYSDFHCNICREFDFIGILWGYPTLDVRKSCINYRKTMWQHLWGNWIWFVRKSLQYLWGYPIWDVGKSCIKYGEIM